jgi:hypothetical protein
LKYKDKLRAKKKREEADMLIQQQPAPQIEKPGKSLMHKSGTVKKLR